MKKFGYILLSAVALVFACNKPEEEKPVVPSIDIPAESQAVFSQGINLEAGTSPQSRTVKFTATAAWSADVTDVKASTWLSVDPPSGPAGSVTLTVTALPNPEKLGREASVTIKCGTASRKFSVKQAGIPNVDVTSVTLDKTSLELVKGQETTLTATVKPDNATDQTVIWTTSAASVVTVENGQVKAVGGGTATITAKAGEQSATCSVTVTVPVISVTLDKTSLELVEGDEAQLTATVGPEDATDPTVTWSSDQAEVATVDQTGKVTAVKEGKASIIAKAGEMADTCVVAVAKKIIPVTSVTLDKTTLELTKGQETTLTATVKPDNATDQTVTWTTSAASVVTVENGQVKAVGGGTATITAKAGDQSATCAVTVTVPVTSVTLDKTSLELVEGDEVTLTATVKPEDATDKTVTWTTSNEAVATIANGKVVAVKEGEATITAKAGDQSATCKVTIAKKVIPVSGISLDNTSLALKEGQEIQLTAIVTPEDATDKTVTWSCNKTGIATVDNTGKVKAVSEGIATITAKAGDQSATCSVTVSKNVIEVTSVILDQITLELIAGETATLAATVDPSDATDKTVTWTTDKANIATVDKAGKVTAVAEGTAVITAKAGSQSATCTVTVNAYVPVTTVTLNKTETTLDKGDKETLTATVKPDGASYKTVTWSSDDVSVASVSSSGEVTAQNGGVTYIRAKADNKEGVCKITVIAPATGVSLNKQEITLNVWAEETLVATVSPYDASDKSVSWSSDKPTIASVDANGKVTALAEGDATITATTHNNLKATCVVHVVIPDTGVTLDQTTLTLNKGDSQTLQATVQPASATDKSVSWKSDKTSVASVNSSGKVTAVGGGEATITVTTAAGHTATCTVTVVVPVESVSLNKTSHTLTVDSSFVLEVSFNPGDATDKSVTWEVEGTDYVTIQSNGTTCTVTAKAIGTATITVRTANNKTAQCVFTIVEDDPENTEGYGSGEGQWND